MIDPTANGTVGTEIVLSAHSDTLGEPAGITYIKPNAAQQGLTIWFTGLSGSGKSTIAAAVHTELLARGLHVEVLDGDVIRKHLTADLGFCKRDRDENIRRIGFVAGLLASNGIVVLVAAISPYRNARAEMRRQLRNFIEVFVNAPLDVCEARDRKGLYKKARAGELKGFTGIDDPYEAPLLPDIQCDTHEETLRACTDKVVAAVLRQLQSASCSGIKGGDL